MKKLNISPFLSQKISNLSIAIIAGISSSILLANPIHAATLGQNFGLLVVTGVIFMGVSNFTNKFKYGNALRR